MEKYEQPVIELCWSNVHVALDWALSSSIRCLIIYPQVSDMAMAAQLCGQLSYIYSISCFVHAVTCNLTGLMSTLLLYTLSYCLRSQEEESLSPLSHIRLREPKFAIGLWIEF